MVFSTAGARNPAPAATLSAVMLARVAPIASMSLYVRGE
jgi:hypothetical protein